MKKSRKDKHFIKKPMYPGGTKAMKELVQKEIVYPKEAIKNKIEGVVRINYWINQKGQVYKTEISISLGHGCDKEAQRLVKLFKFHIPKSRHKKLKFRKTINIHFKLPKKAPVKSVKLVYTQNKKVDPDADAPSSYEYTITI